VRHFHLLKNRTYRPVVNLDKIWTLIGEDVLADAQAGKLPAGQVPLIDLSEHGVFKLLGKGRLPKVPFVVKARFFSGLAERKIKDVGGACVLTA